MCIAPSVIYVESGPGYERVPVACKNCWSCRANRLNDYIGRGLCEASVSDWTASLTLTYRNRDDMAERILTPPHFQQFIRNLRQRNHDYKIRYFVAGEYGDAKGRAHFHTVLFGVGKRPDWPHERRFYPGAWSHGHVFCDWNADRAALKYVMKYINKKQKGDAWFSLSKKPPLGAVWFAELARQYIELGVLPRNFAYRPPGDRTNHNYLMRGATKRDFVLAVVDGWLERRALERDVLTEWVARALQVAEKWRFLRTAKYPPLDEYLDVVSEQLDRGRLSPEYIAKALLWQDVYQESEVDPYEFERKAQEGACQGTQAACAPSCSCPSCTAAAPPGARGPEARRQASNGVAIKRRRRNRGPVSGDNLSRSEYSDPDGAALRSSAEAQGDERCSDALEAWAQRRRANQGEGS